MSVVLFECGAFKLTAKYVTLVDGLCYFRRRLPDDLSGRYPSKDQVCAALTRGHIPTGRRGANGRFFYFSLKTRDVAEAARKAHQIAQQQDAYWQSLRDDPATSGREDVGAALALLQAHGLRPGDAANADYLDLDGFLYDIGLGPSDPDEARPTARGLRGHHKVAFDLFTDARAKPAPFLSEAFETHNRLKRVGQEAGAKRQAEAAYAEFIAIAGDRPVTAYVRQDAHGFVGALAGRGLKPTTIKRYVAQLKRFAFDLSRELLWDLAA